MAIRIRVYPQPGSIGARRNRQRRLHQRQLRQQQALIRHQQQLLWRQQQMQAAYAPGYGSAFGYGTGIGHAAGFGSPVGFGSFLPGSYSSSFSTVPGYGSVGQYSQVPGTSAFGFGTSPLLGAGYLNSSYYGC